MKIVIAIVDGKGGDEVGVFESRTCLYSTGVIAKIQSPIKVVVKLPLKFQDGEEDLKGIKRNLHLK